MWGKRRSAARGGGGMGSEWGQIHSGGGGRELVGGALIAICGGRDWCCIVVIGYPCCPLVPCCHLFIVICSLSIVHYRLFLSIICLCLSFVCIVLLVSGVAQLERGDVNVLAIDCHWVVDGGHVTLVGWVCNSSQGVLTAFIHYKMMMTPLSS